VKLLAKEPISHGVDGVSFKFAPGETLDVSDAEAQALILAGAAEPFVPAKAPEPAKVANEEKPAKKHVEK